MNPPLHAPASTPAPALLAGLICLLNLSAASLPAQADIPAAARASVFIDQGVLGLDNGTLVTTADPLHLQLEFADGQISDARATFGTVVPTVFAPEPTKEVIEIIGPLGDRGYGIIRVNPVSGASHASGAVAGGVFSAALDVSFSNLPGRTFHYVLDGLANGSGLVGTCRISEGGTVIVSSAPFHGYIGAGGDLPARQPPVIDALPAGPDTGLPGFTPPYFGALPAAAIRERVLAGALWLTEAPEVSVFGLDAAYRIEPTGNKQYDNAPFNAYGAAAAFGVLHQLAADPDLRAHALHAAANAGDWLEIVGLGNYRGLATYYKQMFHVTAWGAMAHMELYESTGDPRWLDAVIGYMTLLEDEVTRRMSGPEVRDFPPDDGVPAGRTWTYLNEDTGEVGESNSRYDRSNDNYELNPGSFLWLLGKLRVDHGVTQFADFEQGAREWVADNIDDPDIWDGGSGGVPPGEGSVFHALYMVDYAPVFDQALLDKVLAYVENELIDWSHPVSADGLTVRFAPHVKNKYPRWVSGYFAEFVGGTAVTSRMALVYLKRHAISGDPADFARAQALAHAVLRTQNSESGMIHHYGHTAFSADHAVRLFSGPNGSEPDPLYNPSGRLDQHPYSALKANTLRNLLAYADALEAMGYDCDQPQEISTTAVINKDPTDPPFPLSATATSGLAVQYQLVSGPASLSGDTITLDGVPGIVNIIASQPGDATWCAATPVALHIGVGDNTPATPGDLSASSGSMSTIQLSWTDNADNELRYRIERRLAGESTWQLLAFTPADATSYTDTNLPPGTAFDYRIIATNAVAESPPSAVAEASTLGDEVYLFLDIECADPGVGYLVRDNPDAGGGQDVLVTINQTARDSIDPATILEFAFPVPRTATYALWLRGRAIDGGASDSIWLMVDDGIHVTPGVFYTQPVCNTGYCWKPNNDTFLLEQGIHTITIAARESNAVLDRLLLTTDTANLTSFGSGGPALNCSSGDIRMTILQGTEEGELVLSLFAESGIQYQLETSTNLAEGSWEPSGPPITGAGELIEIRRILDTDARFFRIVGGVQ
jgi:hypothetical protein